MAQDPEREEDLPVEGDVDTSHDFDMIPLYMSQTIDAEPEADVIRGILDSNGIPAMVVRGMGLPSLGFQVQVPRSRLDEAQRLIAEQRAAGPEAAAEAEAASEEGPVA
jgi:hypothetical protein